MASPDRFGFNDRFVDLCVDNPNPLLLTMAQIVYFHPNVIALQKELLHPCHEDLRNKYGSQGAPFDEVIGSLAAEVEILMDGMYTYDEICKNVVPKIVERLIKKRGSLIVIDSGDK